MIARSVAAALLLLVAAGSVAAQSTIYRCGNEYSLSPCGQARRVETESAMRSAAQHAEAVQVATAEKQLAEDMARDRRRAEASIRPAAAGSLGPARPDASAAAKASTVKKGKGKKKGRGENEDFVAVVPGSKS